MNNNCYYFLPTDNPMGGIRRYSELIINILRRSSVDVKVLFDSETVGYDINKFNDSAQTIFIDLGSNSRSAISFLSKYKATKLRRVITIHDPPRITNHYTELFSSILSLNKIINRFISIFIKGVYLRRIFSENDLIIATSHKAKICLEQIFIENKLLLPVLLIEHPLYKDNFVPVDQRENINTLGSFGFGNKIKDFSLIALALSDKNNNLNERLNNLCVKIVSEPIDRGGIKNRKKLEFLIGKLDLKSRFKICNFLDESEMDVFFQSIDVLVLPYKSSNLLSASGPIALAKTYGVPVIASGMILNTAEIGEDVFPFDCNNPASLTEALYQVIIKSDMWLSYIARYRQKQEKQSWPVIGGLYLDVLNQKNNLV